MSAKRAPKTDNRNNGKNTVPAALAEARVATQFKPGNPGRPKGSRNKLGEQLIADLYSDWMAYGIKAIEAMRKEKPAEYVKAAISLLPKQVEVQVSECERMTDEELRNEIVRDLIELGIDIDPGATAH